MVAEVLLQVITVISLVRDDELLPMFYGLEDLWTYGQGHKK